MLLASSGEHSLIPEVADGIQIDLGAPQVALEKILRAVDPKRVAAVVATDDATVELACRVTAALGLPGNPVSAARIARRKDLARQALAEAGGLVPGFKRVDLDRQLEPQLDDIAYPCVVKPLAMAASRGVIRADGVEQLAAACRRVERIAAEAVLEEERRVLLVENFIPGMEVALEGMLNARKLQVLALFDKPDPLDGPFFEETYYVTPSRLDVATQAQVAESVALACRAYGLREGPVHAEVRINREGAWVIEVAARTIGGDCARLLQFGTGVGLEQLVLEHALGQHRQAEAGVGAAGVMMIPTETAGILRRVEGVLDAHRIAGVEEVVVAVREGYELTPLPEGASYLGFIFARGDSPQSVEASLRQAYACLRVVTAPVWRLEPGHLVAS